MPLLLADIPKVLNEDAALVAISDSDLADAVSNTRRYKKRPKNPLAPKPKAPVALDPLPDAVIAPIALLQTLGLAMLPPKHVQMHLASWHWTLLRYAYLIDPPGPDGAFRTNALVGDYRYHHMTALSEALGVGCALSYAQEWLRAQHSGVLGLTIHDPVDIDYLLGAGAGAVPGSDEALRAYRRAHTSSQPDYLLVAERPGALALLLVECKGTSGNKSVALGQLGAALHQLASISFAGTTSSSIAIGRLAFAARVKKGGGPVKLLAVDPPDEGDPWIRRSRPREPTTGERRVSFEDGQLWMPSPEQVADRFLTRLEDRALAWAGAPDRTVVVDPQRASRVRSDFGELAGARSTFRTFEGHTVDVFTGVLLDVIEAIKSDDPTKATEARVVLRDAMATGVQRVRKRWSPMTSDSDRETVASVIDESGLGPRISVS